MVITSRLETHNGKQFVIKTLEDVPHRIVWSVEDQLTWDLNPM
jgi:hypothetical protein